MTHVVHPAPDYEALVRQRLIDRLGVAPSDIGRDMPASDEFGSTQVYYRVRHVGGQGDALNLYPVVDIDVFAKRVSIAKTAANDVEAELVGYARSVQVGTKIYAIGRAVLIRPPVEVPDDSRTARWGATYELPLRR